MLDFGFDKMALIGAVALIVIGPEKLPRVARTVGTLLGKAQRYVADVKAEVNRSMELDELRKMKETVETAARDVEQSVHSAASDFEKQWQDAAADSEYVFYLTAEELAQMNTELHEVMMRWSRLDGRIEHPDRRPHGSAPVEALLFDYPIDVPGRPAAAAGENGS